MSAVIVSILLYSGLQNPQWEMDGDDASQLMRALSDLPRCECPAAIPGGLGYSGIALDYVENGRILRSWTLHKGIAMRNGECFRDAGRSLERHLVRISRQQIGIDIPDDLIEG